MPDEEAACALEDDAAGASDSAAAAGRGSWFSGLLGRLLDLGDVSEPSHHGGWRA